MTSAPAAEMRGLVKHFGSVEALAGIDLAVVAGEVLGLLGPNGAGKTTAIRTLLGYLTPTAGRVAVLGGDAREPSIRRLPARGRLAGQEDEGRRAAHLVRRPSRGCAGGTCGRPVRAARTRPLPADRGTLDRQPAQGRHRPGGHAPAGPADSGRADERPGSPRTARGPRHRPRAVPGRRRSALLLPRAARGRGHCGARHHAAQGPDRARERCRPAAESRQGADRVPSRRIAGGASRRIARRCPRRSFVAIGRPRPDRRRRRPGGRATPPHRASRRTADPHVRAGSRAKSSSATTASLQPPWRPSAPRRSRSGSRDGKSSEEHRWGAAPTPAGDAADAAPAPPIDGLVVWWSLGVALAAVVFASAYPSVRSSSEDLEAYMESLPEGLVEVLGAGAGIASPSGYLNSQFYANVFPLLLIVLGVGAATWAIAGSEGEGTLEMLQAHPVRRTRAAWERLAGVVVVTATVAIVSTAALAAVAPVFELQDGLATGGLWAGTLAGWLVAMTFAAVSFGVGAATGGRGAAIAAGSAAAAGTYVLYGITGFVEALEPLRWLSPWFWFLDTDPLAQGFTTHYWTQAVLLPAVVAAIACVVGVARFVRRDIG